MPSPTPELPTPLPTLPSASPTPPTLASAQRRGCSGAWPQEEGGRCRPRPRLRCRCRAVHLRSPPLRRRARHQPSPCCCLHWCRTHSLFQRWHLYQLCRCRCSLLIQPVCPTINMANMMDDVKTFSFISNEEVESNIFKLFAELHAHQLRGEYNLL